MWIPFLFINSHKWGEKPWLPYCHRLLLFAPWCHPVLQYTENATHAVLRINDMTSSYNVAFKSKSLPGQQESPSFIHPSCIPNTHLHQAFDSFQSVSRTINNGAVCVMGKEIYLSSIKELPCSLLRSWEIGAIIRKGQLTCRHYWWSDTDTSLVLALAFSLSWGSCQELVSQSPCQQGALYELHSQATLWLQRERGIETERERQGETARLSSWCSFTWWEHGDLAVRLLINTAGLFVSNLQ